jgi:hypothetical protein
MSHPIKQLLRPGLVVVSLVVILALALPTAARPASTSTSGHSPLPRYFAGMAYDVARAQVVLFGGFGGVADYGALRDTWTWDGTDWTLQHPAHSPSSGMSMAYDAARGQVVLFGAFRSGTGLIARTWTWDGTDWTLQHPAHSPSPRSAPGMAYDAVRGQVMLFGGEGKHLLGDTWTWDGTDWTQRTPAHSPPSRSDAGMAYDDARGQVVLFGGFRSGGGALGDTWTWDGTDWTRRLAGSIKLNAYSGPPSTAVFVWGWGFLARERVRIAFTDSVSGDTLLQKRTTDATGAFNTWVTIPAGATPGLQHLRARGVTSGQVALRPFTVT